MFNIDPFEFFAKVRSLVAHVPFVPDIVAMYFAMVDDDTPTWAKVQIAGALAYFLTPLDAIPDFIVPVGYGDDAAVISTCLGIVAAHVTAKHRRQAREWLAG
ncbi:MAG: YkvA family protein [Sandaracinaceae bacterium]